MAEMFKCILLNKRFENLNEIHWNMFKGIIVKTSNISSGYGLVLSGNKKLP